MAYLIAMIHARMAEWTSTTMAHAPTLTNAITIGTKPLRAHAAAEWLIRHVAEVLTRTGMAPATSRTHVHGILIKHHPAPAAAATRITAAAAECQTLIPITMGHLTATMDAQVTLIRYQAAPAAAE